MKIESIVDCCDTLGCETAWGVLLTPVTIVGFLLTAALGSETRASLASLGLSE